MVFKLFAMHSSPSSLPESFDPEFIDTQLALIQKIVGEAATEVRGTLERDRPDPRLVQACSEFRQQLPSGATCEIDPRNPRCVIVELPGGNKYRWHMQGDQIITRFSVITPHGDPDMYTLETEVMLYLSGTNEPPLDGVQQSAEELVLAESIARRIETLLGTGWQADKDPQRNAVVLKKNGQPCARIHQQRNGEFVVRYREQQHADPAVYKLEEVHICIVQDLEEATQVLNNRFQ